MKIKMVTENNKSSAADVDVGQRREEGAVEGDGKNVHMQSTSSSSKLNQPPASSGSPTCQNEYDGVDLNLTYPCQALAFDKLYKSHLHALIDDEESNSSKSDKVRRLPIHIVPDEESISSISNHQHENIHEDNNRRIEAEEIEFSELIASPAAAFCRLECGGLPDVFHDVDTDLSNDLQDLIIGGGKETTGTYNLLNDWVQLNDHAGRGDEQGEGGEHDEEGGIEGGKKAGVERQTDERRKDARLSEDEVPRVLTITTPNNSQSQSLHRQNKSTSTVVSATKCSCTIM